MKRAILLVDHGSVFQEANEMLMEVVRLVRSICSGDTLVEGAHMELAGPTIREGIDRCVTAGASEIVVHPYFLSPGRHSMEDIPRLVEEAARPHSGISCKVTEPLGLHRKIAEVVLERVRESEPGGKS